MPLVLLGIIITFKDLFNHQLKEERLRSIASSSSSCVILEDAKQQQHLLRAGGRGLVSYFPNNNTKDDGVLFNYILHIPKTGGVYFQKAANKLIQQMPELWVKMNPEKNVQICGEGPVEHDLVSSFPEHFYEYSSSNTKCVAWSVEGDYNTRADHTFTMIRDPHSHVLSQYFHCKESKDHAYGHDAIGSLDEWLEFWSNKTLTRGISHLEKYKTNSLRRSPFKCYRPINIQARKLKLNSSLILGDDNEVAMQEIRSKFDIIGDNAQMAKTLCTILAHITGILPNACDCSQVRDERTLAGYDHDVQHHGNTFETTDAQNAWIKTITKVDGKLYQYGKIIFAEQVKKVEEDFGVKLCDVIEDF